MNDFSSVFERFHGRVILTRWAAGQKPQVLMCQRKQNDHAARTLGAVLFCHTGEHAVKPVFDIGDGEAADPAGEPGDSFTEVFDDLKPHIGLI